MSFWQSPANRLAVLPARRLLESTRAAANCRFLVFRSPNQLVAKLPQNRQEGIELLLRVGCTNIDASVLIVQGYDRRLDRGDVDVSLVNFQGELSQIRPSRNGDSDDPAVPVSDVQADFS